MSEAALADALRTAALRCGRLSDEQVRSLRRRRRTVIAAVAAMPIGAVVFLSVARVLPTPTTPSASTRTFATRTGERGIATLADGSTVRLNGATRVRVVYAGGRRSAELLAGQAFFDVRHDAARPFVVRAGASETRVLGTAFDLDLTRRQVALAVYRGSIRYSPTGGRAGSIPPACGSTISWKCSTVRRGSGSRAPPIPTALHPLEHIEKLVRSHERN